MPVGCESFTGEMISKLNFLKISLAIRGLRRHFRQKESQKERQGGMRKCQLFTNYQVIHNAGVQDVTEVRYRHSLARECPGVSSRGTCQWQPATGLGALSVAVHAWDLLKEVTIIFITSTIVWPQVNSRKETQLHPSTESWVKDFLSMALPIRTRASFPLSQSLPFGSFHKPLILLYQRADRLKTTITEN